MTIQRYAGDHMVDRQSKIADVMILAVFAWAMAFMLADGGDRGPVFMLFVVLGIIFLAAAVSIMYSYEKKQEI